MRATYKSGDTIPDFSSLGNKPVKVSLDTPILILSNGLSATYFEGDGTSVVDIQGLSVVKRGLSQQHFGHIP